MKRTIRSLESEQVSFRTFEENGERFLEGYASVFGQRSKSIYENNRLFYEIVEQSAFDEALKREDLNVILNLNHDRGRMMARTKSGTLQLFKDDVGLRFKAKVPNTTLGNDVYELVSRGDLYECSFAFYVRKGDDSWAKDEEGNEIRTINKIANLYDVSIVTDGAYANTDVFARDKKLEDRIEPQPGDSEDDFISECIKYVIDSGETEDNKQAYAICKSKWDEKQQKEITQKETLEKNEKNNKELERMRIYVRTLKLKN